MTKHYKRGDVIIADFDPVLGSEQGGIRPALILSNDVGNKYSKTVIIAAVTTSNKPELPTHLPLKGLDFLDSDSLLLLEQIRTIDLKRVTSYIGTITFEKMKLVDQALAISVGLVNKKRKGLIMTLCSQCADVFFESPYHEIHRLDPLQKNMESCTYCNVRHGYDYTIRPKKNLVQINKEDK